MLVIRLARHGRKKRPFYHIVCAEKTRAVQKKFIEKLGHYDPLANGGKGEVVINNERVEYRVSTGAQMSQTVARILNKNGVACAEKFIDKRHSVAKKEAPVVEKPAEETPAPEAETSVEEASTEA